MEVFTFILEMIVYVGCIIGAFHPDIDLKMMMFFCTIYIAMVIRHSKKED